MNQTMQPMETTPMDRRVVVEFEYPDSVTRKMKLRFLRLISADDQYVKGYELVSPNCIADGQFKSFARNRLPRNGVSVLSYY